MYKIVFILFVFFSPFFNDDFFFHYCYIKFCLSSAQNNIECGIFLFFLFSSLISTKFINYSLIYAFFFLLLRRHRKNCSWNFVLSNHCLMWCFLFCIFECISPKIFFFWEKRNAPKHSCSVLGGKKHFYSFFCRSKEQTTLTTRNYYNFSFFRFCIFFFISRKDCLFLYFLGDGV